MNMKMTVLWLLLCLAIPLQAGVSGDLRKAGKLYKQEKYGEALSKFEKALSQDPTNEQAVFGAGAAAYYLKEYDQAAQAFDQVATSSGNQSQDAWFNLGNTYYRAGQKEKAIEAYKQAILANPQDKEAIHNLQLVLQDQQGKNKNNQNNQNQDQDSQNQDSKDNNDSKGQAPQQQPQQQPQQEPQPQPDQGEMDKQAAQRLMQLARDNEYKHPTQPGTPPEDNTVEKDW